jgi:hypothetical protein
MGVVEIRCFTPDGNEQFATLVRTRPFDLSEVKALLVNDNYTEAVKDVAGKPVTIDVKFFATRFELAKELWRVFGRGAALSDRTGDVAVWNWLSAAWMETLITDPSTTPEKVLGKEDARWVLTSSVLRYHRHLISGPFFAYEANFPDTDNALCLLASPVIAPGEVVERIAGKRSLSIGSVCHLATLLYIDPATKQFRKGHTSGPGKPRNFSYYFSQLDVNVDYLGMSVDSLLDILPRNFEKWVNLARAERKS